MCSVAVLLTLFEYVCLRWWCLSMLGMPQWRQPWPWSRWQRTMERHASFNQINLLTMDSVRNRYKKFPWELISRYIQPEQNITIQNFTVWKGLNFLYSWQKKNCLTSQAFKHFSMHFLKLMCFILFLDAALQKQTDEGDVPIRLWDPPCWHVAIWP